MQKNNPASLTRHTFIRKKTETKAGMKRKIKFRQKLLDIINTDFD